MSIRLSFACLLAMVGALLSCQPTAPPPPTKHVLGALAPQVASISATTTTGSTSAASPVIAQADASTVRYEASVIARDQATGNSYTARIVGVWKRNGSTMTQSSPAQYQAEIDEIGLAPSARPNFAASGTGIVFNVTGLSGLTISFGGRIETTSFTYSIVAPSFPVYNGAKVTNFSAANYLSAAPASCPSLASGHTVYLRFSWDAQAARGGDYEALYFCGTAPAGNAAAAGDKGWLVVYVTNSGSLQLWMLNGASLTTYAIGQPVVGLNDLVVWNNGTTVRWTMTTILGSFPVGALGPSPVASGASPTYVAPDSGSVQQMGLWGYASGPNVGYFYSGGVVALGALSRSPASDAEATGWGQSVAPTTTASRYTLPTAFTGDASCTVDWNAFRDWNGVASTSTSLGSAPITYTVNASPTRTTMAEEYLSGANLAPVIVDSAGGALVSGNHLSTSPLARTVFTTPVGQQQVGLAYVGTDTQVSSYNFDQLGVFSDGTYIADSPSTPGSGGVNDGTVHLYWFPASTSPTSTQTSHVIQTVGAARIAEPNGGTVYGGYYAGAQVANGQTFTTTTPNKRLVAGLDSIVNGYYQTPPNTGVGAKMRALFPSSGGPGGTTILGWGGYALQDEISGNGISGSSGGLTALGQLIATEAAKVVGAGAQYFYDDECFNTYNRATQTPTAWATSKGQLYDAIHAANSSVVVWFSNCPQSFYSSTANGLGFTLANYNTAAATITSGRSYAHICDLTGAGITFSDHIHPDGTSNGTTLWESTVRTCAGW